MSPKLRVLVGIPRTATRTQLDVRVRVLAISPRVPEFLLKLMIQGDKEMM
jgi:hypothetical protein